MENDSIIKTIIGMFPIATLIAIFYFASSAAKRQKRIQAQFERDNPDFIMEGNPQDKEYCFTDEKNNSEQQSQNSSLYSYKPIDDGRPISGGLMQTFDSHTSESMADEYNKRVEKMVASFAPPVLSTGDIAPLETAEPIRATHRNAEGLVRNNAGVLFKEFTVKKAIIYSEILSPKF